MSRALPCGQRWDRPRSRILQVDWNAGIALDVHSRACERNADCCIADQLWVAASPRRASRQPCAISPPSKTRTSPKEFTRPGGPSSSPRCRRGSQRSKLHAWSYSEPWSGAVAAACTQCLAGSFWRCRASAVATGCPTLPYLRSRTRTSLLIRSSRREPRHSRGPRPGPLLDPEASTLRRRPRCVGGPGAAVWQQAGLLSALDARCLQPGPGLLQLQPTPLQAVGGQAPARPGAAPGGGDCEGEGCHGAGALQAGRASRHHSAGVASTRACAHVHACAGWLLDPPAWSPSRHS